MINIDSLRQDPEFTSRSPEDQQRLLSLAEERNASDRAAGPPQTYGEAVKRAGKNVALAIPRTLLGGANLALDLWREPRATAAAAMKAAPETALSMIPMQGYFRKRLTGQPVTGPETLEEALEVLGSRELPKFLGLAKRGVRAGARHLPGATVALHEMAIPEVQAAAKAGRPSEASVVSAFAAASAADAPAIWMGDFRRTARKLLRHEMTLSSANRDAQLVGDLRSFLDESRQGWSPQQWKAELDRMGARLGGVAGVEGMSRVHDKELRTLMRAMYKDIETAKLVRQVRPAVPPTSEYVRGEWVDTPGQPARHGPAPATEETLGRAAAWKEAQRLARRAHGFDEIESMVNAPGVISVTGDQYQSLNINGVLRSIDRQIRLAGQVSGKGVKRAKRFVGSFEPGELEALRAKFEEIGGDLPRIPVGKGTAHGSGGYIIRAVLGELGGAAIGHPAVGAAVGVGGPALVARAVMTKRGRAAIKYASRIDPSMRFAFQQTLAAFLRSQMRGEAPAYPLPPPWLSTPTPEATPSPGGP